MAILNDPNELKLPLAFSGPAQLILYTRYGDPRNAGWQHKWLHNWHVHQLHPWFPVREMQIHKHFWPVLQGVFLELEKAGLHFEIETFDCCHNLAYLHESPVLSVHSWGAAIDMNAATNPNGTRGKWSDDFLHVMTKHGVHCGQDWTGSKAPMHFAMVPGD